MYLRKVKAKIAFNENDYLESCNKISMQFFVLRRELNNLLNTYNNTVITAIILNSKKHWFHSAEKFFRYCSS